MKKNTYLMLASTALLLASCADDKFTGDGGANGLTDGTAPIAFNMQGVGQTRASQIGKTAAEALHYEFIVWGEKNETNGKSADESNLVFKNYRVQYKASTANKTTSNRRDWEYVGITPYAESLVSPAVGGNTTQTIKYWDLNASSYTFTAVSAAWNDLHNSSSPNVKITKTQSDPAATEEATGSAENKGYTIELMENSHPDSIYVSDRKTITKLSDGKSVDTTAVNAYGGIAQLTFRNFMSKIRFGIWEDVPGYKVVITGIKYSSDASNTVEHKSSSTETGGTTFGITGNFVAVGGKSSTEGSENTKYTVTYETSNNKAKVTVNDKCNKSTFVNTTGTNWLSTSWTSTPKNTIAESNSKPTYDRGENNAGTYTTILPNPSNTTDMTLEISYDLYSEDTGEKISVDYKKAVVPAAYCQWKSNYAYTYIFKISDKSSNLYPITFDAVVETDDNGNQETITTVTEPSITTFATRTTNGVTSVVTDGDEYQGDDVIYASVVDGNAAVELKADDNSTNIALYTVTPSGNATITEASVADAIAKKAANENWNGNITVTKINATETGSDQSTTTNWEITVTSGEGSYVPDVDGTNRTISALKWTASANTTYAVEYTKTVTGEGGNSTSTKYYKIVKVGAAPQGGN